MNIKAKHVFLNELLSISLWSDSWHVTSNMWPASCDRWQQCLFLQNRWEELHSVKLASVYVLKPSTSKYLVHAIFHSSCCWRFSFQLAASCFSFLCSSKSFQTSNLNRQGKMKFSCIKYESKSQQEQTGRHFLKSGLFRFSFCSVSLQHFPE